MKTLIVFLFFLLPAITSIAVGSDKFEVSEEEIAGIHKALADWRKYGEYCQQNPSSNEIEKLALGLRKTHLKSIYFVGDRETVHNALKKALLAIPGHAEYFGKKIVDTHREYKKTPYGGITQYTDALHTGWATLKHLPSPETVKVAGEMLSDEWVNELDKDHYRPPSLAIAAASILSGLPLKDKPYPFRGVPTTDQVAESLPHWQKWYQEVKEGHRTFSFEGDPNEYDLNGPIREAKNPDIPAATKQPAPAPQEQASDKPPTTPPFRAPWIAAVLAAIITLAGWLFLKKRKAI